MDTDDNKSRPLRLYGTDGHIYVFSGGKKRPVKTKLKKSTAQAQYMNKLTGKLKLDSGIKQERATYLSSGVRLIPLDKLVTNVTDMDEGLKAKKRIETDIQSKLDDIKKKAKEGRPLTEEEKILYPLYLEEKTSGNLEEKKLRDAQANRNELINAIFDEYKLDARHFPIGSWNGLHHGTVRVIDHYLRWLIDNLMNSTPFEVIDMLGHAGLVIPLTNQERPNNNYRHYTAEQINTPNQINRAIQHDLQDKRANIVSKFLAYLTPRVFNSFVNQNRVVLRRNRQIPYPEQVGTGNKLPALWNDQIDDYFSRSKYPNYGGTIAADQIKDLPKKLPIGFIMNLDDSSEPGSHWVAVYISGDSVEYFDPLGQPPSDSFKKDIKKYLEGMKIPILMKFKINNVKWQSDTSNHCGWFCIQWLDNRFNNIPFVNATKFTNLAVEGEKKLKKEFDYI
jgi:hypothetical protein